MEEEFHYKSETTQNSRDPYGVVVKKDGITVDHLPHKISRMCLLFLMRGGNFSCANFCCLAEPQNFFTIETFANYGTCI